MGYRGLYVHMGNGKGLGQFCSKFSLKFLKKFEAIIIPIYIYSFGLTFFVERLYSRLKLP